MRDDSPDGYGDISVASDDGDSCPCGSSIPPFLRKRYTVLRDDKTIVYCLNPIILAEGPDLYRRDFNRPARLPIHRGPIRRRPHPLRSKTVYLLAVALTLIAALYLIAHVCAFGHEALR